MTTADRPAPEPDQTGPPLRVVPDHEPGFTPTLTGPDTPPEQHRDRAGDPHPDRPPTPDDTGTVPARRLRLTKASQVQIRPTYWTWEGRIPHGAITLGPGREGIGKSLFCSWLAAQVTLGTLEGLHQGQPKGVIYAATEDSWEATIAPRLIAAGADTDRVYRVEVTSPAGNSLPLTLPRDCAELATEITEADVSLLILDPLISAVDSRVNVNQEELRTALEPLSALADSTGCAVFGLAHFNKGTGTDVLSRVTGSRAFSAVARAAVAFARDPDAEDGSCVMSQVKNNLGSLALPSLRYIVEPVTLDTLDGPAQWGRLRFLGETDTHVETILAEPTGKDTHNGSGRTHALDTWLVDYLTERGGSASSTEITTDAEKAGYSQPQLKRARRRLGNRIDVVKTGLDHWVWTLTH
ncbi:AAA family ATPase [Actinopolyspora mortivallis]|uniref:AAA family ATPase n=1 Tax=Actinopolyspora mortivallis TaxID=33906 RepID=A0A2T0GRG4_ACTMO|nr:AAA family ATPase [Actinopolyspora mortivallis]PRW61677.1 hypothetical protein CEP50_19445 [Actinopolyspora mortivallis]